MAKTMKTMDGNMSAAYVSYAFTEVAGIYPITPSTPMAEQTDEWAANGRKNIFGQPVKIVELQSEAGAAGTVHGSLSAGALTTTYTASQGLLLMIPNMYKMAGELLPAVLHVSARAIAGHALSIFGDHSDVMACRQTGFALLASSSVQETMDLGAVAHLSAIKGRVPFLHFFDGFRTSHEIQKIECLEYDDLAKLVDTDMLNDFRKRSLNPERPITKGTAQNPDIFFQAKESSNSFYQAVPSIVEEYMGEINKLTGRDYQLFNYYGAEDATKVIVAMGSACEAIEEVVDFLNATGEKVGLLKVRLFRPFVLDKFIAAIPKTATKIAVLDRTKEPGALGEPLYQDVCTAYFEKNERPLIVGGRYGLGSKDVTPAQIIAVYKNLDAKEPKNHFTVGINDDVTNLSLEVGPDVDVAEKGTISCKFWGLGSDGTVGANKNSIKIIGDNTDMYAQAYFSYDSKKSGGITQSHLRFGKKPIKSTYLVNMADFVACHNQSYVYKYDMLAEIKEGGKFLFNTSWTPEELEVNLPAKMKKDLHDKKVKFYTIDATAIAKELGLGNRTNSVLQAAFFAIADIIPAETAVGFMKKAIEKTYGKKGQNIVDMNNAAIDSGVKGFKEIPVPASWANPVEGEVSGGFKIPGEIPAIVKNIVNPVNALKGDFLPVSTFKGIEAGEFAQGTAAFEKRGIAVDVPEWVAENCIQCNHCAYVCPHACIRPFLATEAEMANAPEGFVAKQASGKGFEDYKYRMQVDALDCTGCGNCAQVCPAKEKALVMKPLESQMPEMENWYYGLNLSVKENPANVATVKGSQFEQPLLEFSGACAGCGETPYAKLVTQLFGDSMIIANATGCSSIWSGSAPATPYTTNSEGRGPAWANSLFEDNAEYGFGMHVATGQIRDGLKAKVEKVAELSKDAKIAETNKEWLETLNDTGKSKVATKSLVSALTEANLSGEAADIAKDIINNKEFLSKKSQWIIGGDGWAYDIGFGGLDHVIASGENVNILVFDTEVYSNTGGQSSKSSPTASVAKFTAAGKRIRKKDLGMIAMSYGYVYVAQVSMGADKNQLIKALIEAESYDGPSIILAYAPCIAHGIKAGMTMSQEQAKRAVEAGYWQLFRYNPMLEAEGKNPFILDSKEPTASFRDFIMSEVRYTSLQITFPEVAEELFVKAEEDAKRRLATYKKLAGQ